MSPGQDPAPRTDDVRESAAVFDLDSTLCDTRERAATMIDKTDRSKTDWTAYAKACGSDKPTDVLSLVHLLAPTHQIVLLTSRPEAAIKETVAWLTKHQVGYSMLIMDDGRFEHASDYKVAAIEWIQQFHQVDIVVEDWWETAEAIRFHLHLPVIVPRVYPPTALQPAF